MEESCEAPSKLERPKFQFLRKGVGQKRIIQRGATLQPLSEEHLTGDNKTPNSAPLKNNNMSLIFGEPAKSGRPTTAETGDSGFREVNFQFSPTTLTSSRNTITPDRREPQTKSPSTSSPKESVSDQVQQLVQRFTNNAPRSARQIESNTSNFSSPRSHNSSYRSTPEQCFIDRGFKSLGIFPPENYVLPPRPRELESPERKLSEGFHTPTGKYFQSNNFLQTPILPEKFIGKKEGQVVESLAEQLRALLVLLDAGMAERKRKIDQIRYVYDEKAKDVKRKEKEMKERINTEEKKVIDMQAKIKLEIEKNKGSKEAVKNLEEECQELKNKVAEKSSLVSENRISRDRLQQKLKKLEEELAQEKEKSLKLSKTNDKLTNEISYERKVRLLQRQNYASLQPPEQHPTRQPLRQIPVQRPNHFGMPSISSQSTQKFQAPEQPPRPIPNPSHSSNGPRKNVHWKEEQIDEMYDLSTSNAENISNSLKDDFISGNNYQLLYNPIDSPLFTEEQYRRFGCYRVMKTCGCESIRYDDSNLQYRCSKKVNVNVCYFDENGQISVTLPGQFVIKSFPSKQLEIHRDETNEKSIIVVDGTRYEYKNVPGFANQSIEIFKKDEWKRHNPPGSSIIEEWIVADEHNFTTKRAANDYVLQENNCITFYCPGFRVTRSLSEDDNGMLAVVCTIDEKRFWKLKICPADRVFTITHYNGNKKFCCTYSEIDCDHIKR